jgi:hypothetical protein
MIEKFSTGFYTKLKLWPTTWVAATPYAVGAIMKPTTYASHAYKCTTAGTSAASVEPTWNTTNGGTTADGTGTLVWTTFDPLVYNTMAPQTAVLPYVVYGLLTDMPLGDFADPATIEDMTFYVNVFSSTSVAHVMQIADLVKTVMDNVTLSITGYTAMRCMREFTSNVNYNVETKVFSVSLRYRVMGSK